MNRKRKILFALVIVVLALISVGWRASQGGQALLDLVRSNLQQQKSEGVILIPIEYKDERWFVGQQGVFILPCDSPSEMDRGEITGPLVSILGPKGEIIYSQKLPMDPRFLLYEGPSEKSNILDQVSITLKVPLMEGAISLEYYLERNEDGTVEKKEPVITIDLMDAIGKYYENGGSEATAPCQQPEYLADALGKRE